MDKHLHLSRRERQIMDILYEHGAPSVGDIRKRLPDPPSHTAVRTLLKILENKGHITRRKRGREFLYRAKHGRQRAGRSAMQRVIQTFFDGSLEKALGAHLADQRASLRPGELERLAQLIDEARQQGD